MVNLIQLSPANSVLPVNDELLDDGDVQNSEHRFVFKIGRFEFVLAKTLTTEILVKPTIYHIPNSPDWLFGMVNLRGNIHPIVDISTVLKTDYVNSPGDFILVIDKGRESLALLVDSIPRLLNDSSIAETLSETSWIMDEFVQPGVKSGNNILDQLDIKGLVNSLKVCAES